ncbi:MAG: hypothetical protein LBJ61_01045 [Deltaproteobacteria bacterium]|nr:hypothetical protein [Deltaproteobacteria bacterium]
MFVKVITSVPILIIFILLFVLAGHGLADPPPWTADAVVAQAALGTLKADYALADQALADHALATPALNAPIMAAPANGTPIVESAVIGTPAVSGTEATGMASPAVDPLGSRLKKSLNKKDLDDWVLGTGLAASPGNSLGFFPILAGVADLGTFTVGGVEHRIDRAKAAGTLPLLGDVATVGAELGVERRAMGGFGTGRHRVPARGYSTVNSELGLNLYPSPNWSLGASFTVRDTQSFGLGDSRRETIGDRPGVYGPLPSDSRMGRLRIGYQNGLGTGFSLRGYSGRMAEGGFLAGILPGREVPLASVEGFGASVRQEALDGRFTLSAGGSINRLDFGDGSQASPYAPRYAPRYAYRSGRNLSAYLAMAYLDPELFGIGIMYRYGSDGYFVSDSALIPGFGRSYLDATVWRDFALTPALKLTAQLFGSVPLDKSMEIHRVTKPNLLDNYVEGRVTMNYAF